MKKTKTRMMISFSAFVIFMVITAGFLFWLSTRIIGVGANNDGTVTVQQLHSQEKEYAREIDKFKVGLSGAATPIEFLKSYRQNLLAVRVPKTLLQKHFQLVTFVDQVLSQKKGLNELTLYLQSY